MKELELTTKELKGLVVKCQVCNTYIMTIGDEPMKYGSLICCGKKVGIDKLDGYKILLRRKKLNKIIKTIA